MKLQGKKGIIKVKTDGFLSCLSIKEPLMIDWPANNGSIERYYACFPPNENYKSEIEQIRNLTQNINNINEFIESGFLDLLDDGDYDFSIRRGVNVGMYVFNLSLHNSNSMIKDNFNPITYMDPYEMTESITMLYYPSENGLSFTRPIESLDPTRIKYYEELIKKGERPKAIVIRLKLYFPELEGDKDTHYSPNYVIDGHHKLAAYFRLRINPDLIQIEKERAYDMREFDYDILPKIKDKLYGCQLTHIISNGLRTDFSKEKTYEKLIDSYLRETNILKEDLLYRLGRYFLGYQTMHEQMEWKKIRIAVLEKRFLEGKSKVFLDYHCNKDLKGKRIQTNDWNVILKIIEEN